jgi:hypothetical protein
MSGRVPRCLTKKRNQLAYEAEQMRARLAVVGTELAALDYALTIIEPEYKPPRNATAPRRPALLPAGGIARACRQLLPSNPGIDTTSFAKLVASGLKIKLKTKEERFRFASAVAMSLRRFEKRGSAVNLGKDPKTGTLRWRARSLDERKLSLVRSAS